jgi:CheY-like chemotaxis protein
MPDVLIVEDEFALCEFLTYALRREMLPFRLAQSGQEALDLAAELWPSVVLLDLSLPGMLDGWQVWDTLQERADQRPLRVILFAAELGFAAEWQARQRSVWAILRKPVSRSRLVERLRAALAEVEADA